jgi:stage II sporulation protein D
VASGANLEWTDVAIRDSRVAFGQKAPVAGPLELHAETDGSLWVSQTVGAAQRQRAYRGILRFIPAEGGAIRVVNVLSAEAYLAGVLANELPKAWHVEAYKAQAVAARSYALAERNLRTRYDFDVGDSAASQVYGGYSTETRTAWEAVHATWGIVTTYRGAGGKTYLLKAYYHSTCGGETISAGSAFGGPTPPPLAGGVPCTYCVRSPKFRWPDVVLTKQEIGDALKRSGDAELARLGPVDQVEVAATSGPGGRPEQIRMADTAGAAVLVQANYWRALVGNSRVPSTWFTLRDQGDRLLITDGRGYGHGVGLCQWGAEYLAEHGQTGEQILRYYYPKVELLKAY